MISYLHHHQIDQQKWDNCIERSLNGRIYGYSWYLNIVCPGWDGMIEDDYLSVFPLTFNTKFGISYLYQPYFTQQLGLFSTEDSKITGVSEFLALIPSEFRFAEIQLNEGNRPGPEISYRQRVNLVLDLSTQFGELQKKFNQNTRRNIKKAGEQDLSVITNVTPSELISLFRKNFGEQEGKLSDNDYRILEQLMNTAIERKVAGFYGVRNGQNDLLAGVFLLHDRKRWIFHFAASSSEGKRKGAMFRLMEHILKEKSGTSAVLDFEGSDNDNVARFYRGFGANDSPYFLVSINRLSWVISRLVFLAKKLKSNKL